MAALVPLQPGDLQHEDPRNVLALGGGDGDGLSEHRGEACDGARGALHDDVYRQHLLH
jgi:hypothetical protein